MPELLPIGRPMTLVQNQTYDIPVRAWIGFVQGSGVEMSNDGTTWQAVTLDTNKNFQPAGTFIRSTAVATTVTFKA